MTAIQSDKFSTFSINNREVDLSGMDANWIHLDT